MQFRLPDLSLSKCLFKAINQVYELEQKLKRHGDAGNYQRNIDNIRDAFGDMGLACEDPMGQPFNETRTDLDAIISGLHFPTYLGLT